MGIALCLGMFAAVAQDLHIVPLQVLPTTINPAFSGGFDGRLRADAMYQRSWAGPITAYVAYGVSVDAPLYFFKNGDYIGGGINISKQMIGDGYTQNFAGGISLSYHKPFALRSANGKKNSELAIGFQGGYNQQTISQYYAVLQTAPVQPYHLGVGNAVSSYTAAAGISFSQILTPRVHYTIGVAAYNLNQPNDAIERQMNKQERLSPGYIGFANATCDISKRLSVQPTVAYERQDNNNKIVGGSNVQYTITTKAVITSVYVGGWYGTGDIATVTTGMQVKSVRVGFGYDRQLHNGNETGFSVHARCTVPKGKHKHIKDKTAQDK